MKLKRRSPVMSAATSHRPHPSSLLGTGGVPPTTSMVPASSSSVSTGTSPEVMSTAELMSEAFTRAGDGVSPPWVSRYHCTNTAQAPLTCGPAWEVPP